MIKLNIDFDKKQVKQFNDCFNDLFLSYKASIGWFPDRNTTHKNNKKSSEIASIHITGSPAGRVPQRNFIGIAMNDYKEQITGAFQNAVKNTEIKKGWMFPILKYTGIFILDLFNRFLNNNGEGKLTPLSEQTKKRKGHDRMLEETKKMKDDMQVKIVKNYE